MHVTCMTGEWETLLELWRDRPEQDAGEEGIIDDTPVELPESAGINQQAHFVLEAAAKGLDASSGKDLLAVLYTFGAVSGPGGPRDDGTKRAGDAYYAVMSPDTLKTLVARAERIDRAQLETLVERVKGDYHFDDRLDTARDYVEYFDSWVEAYRLAAADAHGVIVVVG